MTTVEITLPDQLAKEAQRAGLLTPERLEQLLREELKTQRIGDLFAAIERMDRVTQPAMSPEDVAAEIAAMRSERRKSAP
jgi:hypothetical protein